MNREKLIINNTNLIYLALKNLNLYNKLDEYYDVGMIGLVKGANTYDETLNYKESTYLYKCIYNEILLTIRRDKRKKIIPDYMMISLYTPITDNLVIADFISDDIDIEKELIKKEQIDILHNELLKLTELEQLIINLSFGINGYEQTAQLDIAKKLNLSQPQICRIRSKALKKLRKVMSNKCYE